MNCKYLFAIPVCVVATISSVMGQYDLNDRRPGAEPLSTEARVAISKEISAAAEFWRRIDKQELDAAETLLAESLRDELGPNAVVTLVQQCEQRFGTLHGMQNDDATWVGILPVIERPMQWKINNQQPTDTIATLSFDDKYAIDGIWLRMVESNQNQDALAWGRLLPIAKRATNAIDVKGVGRDGNPRPFSQHILWKHVPELTPTLQQRGDIWQDKTTGKNWLAVRSSTGRGSHLMTALPPGTYRVTALMNSTSLREVTISDEIELTEGLGRKSVAIQLEDRPDLEVAFIDAESQAPIPGMEFRLQMNDPQYPNFIIGPNQTTSRPPGQGVGPNPPRQSWEFHNLYPGEYLLTAVRPATHIDDMVYELDAPGFAIVRVGADQEQFLRIALKGRHLTPEEIAAQWNYSIVGHVRDRNGKPIPNAKITATQRKNGTAEVRTLSTHSDATGAYRLYFGDGQDIENTPYTRALDLYVQKPGYVDTNSKRRTIWMAEREPPQPSHTTPYVDGHWVVADQPYALDISMAESASVQFLTETASGAKIPPHGIQYYTEDGNGDIARVPRTPFSIGEQVFELPVGVTYYFYKRITYKQVPPARAQPIHIKSAGKYTIRAVMKERRVVGDTVLNIRSVLDENGDDVTQQIMGEDPTLKPAVSVSEQLRGEEILTEMGRANSHWLNLHSLPTCDYSYQFQSQNDAPRTYNISKGRPVEPATRHGMIFQTPLHTVVEDPSSALFTEVRETESEMHLAFHARNAFSPSIRIGVENKRTTSRPYPSLPCVLVVDKQRLTPIQLITYSPSPNVIHFEQYHEVTPSHWVPLSARFGRDPGAQWTFQTFPNHLWLFAQNSNTQPGMLNAHLSNVEINGSRVTPLAVGKLVSHGSTPVEAAKPSG